MREMISRISLSLRRASGGIGGIYWIDFGGILEGLEGFGEILEGLRMDGQLKIEKLFCIYVFFNWHP